MADYAPSALIRLVLTTPDILKAFRKETLPRTAIRGRALAIGSIRPNRLWLAA